MRVKGLPDNPWRQLALGAFFKSGCLRFWGILAKGTAHL